ncbi:MAG: dihydropteroate synthase [Planctomycetaceae bacterium]
MNASNDPRLRTWAFGRRHYELGRFPLLMGIVNVTPDSFSDGGEFLSSEAAVRHALDLVDQGADLLDIGGESTRPGAAVVPVDEELRRVLPVIKRLARETDVPLSIDTTKAEAARQALLAGAEIVNDISGLAFDPDMIELCRRSGAGVVCMHIQGTPQTMQLDPQYVDVVEEVRAFLDDRLRDLGREGIPAERVVLDPGIGFGKTAEHNLAILSHVGRLRELGRPVLIGHSRKRFLKRILGRPVEERTSATVGVAVALAMQSTDILRVHDVRSVRDALVAWRAVAERIR